jgi:hypothetical protein
MDRKNEFRRLRAANKRYISTPSSNVKGGNRLFEPLGCPEALTSIQIDFTPGMRDHALLFVHAMGRCNISGNQAFPSVFRAS